MNALAGSRPRVLNLKQARDFERVLGKESAARTPHFAIHHVRSRPLRPHLSTGTSAPGAAPVDDSSPEAVWLGLVIPKRHARRSVTRSLLKRQIRAAVNAGGPLQHGLWVVRLRSGFDRSAFPSATSEPLARAARAELDALVAKAARPVTGSVSA